MLLRCNYYSCHAFNTTVDELELRVELLEEDLLQAQTTILNLEFYLQETIETVIIWILLKCCQQKSLHFELFP